MKIDLRTIPDAEVSGIDLMDVDITLPAPEAEPQRQYYFMALLKQQLVPERAKKNGKEFLTACITTFGCQMNARDSEKLEGILETVGYHIVETEDADFVVYNTCTVRENANLRVYGRLGQLSKYKKKSGMIISDVVRKVRYDSAFTFQYSRRTGTPAAAMEDQIPVDVVKDRFDRLLAEVQEISREVTARHTHTVQEVLVESINEQDPSLVTGRMSNNTLVHFKGDASLIGTLQNVYLDECRGFYYMGTPVENN